jgi:transposase
VFKAPPKAVPHNSFYRKDKAKKKVIIRLKPDRKKLKERKCLSEHSLRHVEMAHGAYYLLCKGKEKVSAELGLSFLATILKERLTIAGFDKLLARDKG